MLIALHILIAISSLIAATFAVIKPSERTLKTGALLTALTAISGTVLIAKNHAHMLSACVTGLTYLGFTTAALLTSRYRLARVAIRIRNK
jgi:hypothetical protein